MKKYICFAFAVLLSYSLVLPSHSVCTNIVREGSKKGSCEGSGGQPCQDIQQRPGSCKTVSQAGPEGKTLYNCVCEPKKVTYTFGDEK